MSLPYDVKNPKSIEQYAMGLIGKTLREVIPEIREDDFGGKGNFGQTIEKHYFLYEPNNDSQPDFPQAGLELKTTPLKILSNKEFRAKERLSMNMIDFMKEHELTWQTSSFWVKNQRLLIVFYLHDSNKLIVDRKIKMVGIWDYPPEDIHIMRYDWEKIVQKIKDGNAHQLSEGDTLYLGASTKGAGKGRDLVDQPFSSQKAKKRAFSLKQKYVNHMINNWPASKKTIDMDSVIKDISEYAENETFEDLIYKKMQPFIEKTIDEIHEELKLEINRRAKNYYAVASARMLGVGTNKIEEFEKADITIKSIRLQANNKPKESMSFPAFKYKEIIKETWETSRFRAMLEKRFFFVVFKQNDEKQWTLKKVMFWTIPYEDIEGDVKKVWKETVKRIENREAHDLPKSNENGVCHVRPHGKNKDDTYETHYGEHLMKKSFWLNASYIAKQVATDITD